MAKTAIWAAGITVGLFSSLSVQAACPPAENAPIVLALDFAVPPPPTRRVSGDGLRQRLNEANNHRGWGRVLGLTTSTMRFDPDVEAEQVTLGSTTCIRLKRLEVIFTLKQEVFVDRKYQPGSCEARLIRDHEFQHVAFNRDTFWVMRPQIEVLATQLIEPLSGRWFSPAGVERELQNALNVLQSRVWADLRSRAAPLHASIDGMGAYVYAIRRCSNW